MRNLMKEWLKGHITITIRGKRFERLLNLAVREGIQLWNIRRIAPDIGKCDIWIRDYFRLRPLLRQTGCRSHVERREGLPFWLIRLRMRAGFTLGAVLFLVGLYMMSTFVWRVEIRGAQQIPAYQVQQAAEKVGIKEGAWKAKLKETKVLQRELLNLLPQASWIGVELNGTKAIIQVVERQTQEPEKPLGPRNLIAKKRAVVHSIVAEAGKSMVRVNQFVDKGQVLISGVLGNETRQALVAARGKVEGEVWYVSNVSVPTTRTQYHLTGQQQELYYLVLGSYAVRLWPFEAQSYAQSRTTEERYQAGYAQYALPIVWKKVIQQEMAVEKKEIGRDEAVETAKRFARMDVLSRAGKGAIIQDEKVLHVKTENGKVYLSIHYSVIEDIAAEQPIVARPPVPHPSGN
ncbi:sporulation protein YqfD [Brevibacillus sp. SYP-B805]|uniref:sporulation protein YqfD n=1 Tax=Brevibacillus sp. SYP-B805 TaxID=1578199 RepID=UPI0013EA85F2|nr:sporulation protein YqfD [Brevibacillus sp. SYP-B805]NGQ94115.1 sporulation protein YqfD [Brevibacillus sp. SYP-B805]